MIEDRLSYSLYSNGYQRVNSNAQGIYLYYHVGEDDLTIVSVIHAAMGNELTLAQYEHILDQIRNNYRNTYPHRIKLLSLILTDNPDRTKHLATQAKQDNHWIIDMRNKRLIIYENQSEEFRGLQQLIEQVLSEEQERGMPSRRPNNRFALTPVTASIIAINIIVYLINHFTPAFGGEEQMMEMGALSWFYIREGHQYYRIFTSMFMHADWSHLAGNMVVLLFIGGNLERAIGKLKLLFIYFGSGILAGISSISYNMWKEYANVAFTDTTFSVGASGAIFGIVGAILYIVIVNKGRLQEISTQQMILFIILSLYNGVVNSRIDQAAHIGGFISGVLLAVLLYRRPGIRRPDGNRSDTQYSV